MDNKNNDWVTDDIDELLMAIHHLDNLDELRAFFRDLLTIKELEEYSNRWKIARMLDAGVTYVKIEQVTSVSSATVARVHKWLKAGTQGYRLMLDKMK